MENLLQSKLVKLTDQKCGKCSTRMETAAVKCDQCGSLFHVKCTGLPIHIAVKYFTSRITYMCEICVETKTEGYEEVVKLLSDLGVDDSQAQGRGADDVTTGQGGGFLASSKDYDLVTDLVVGMKDLKMEMTKLQQRMNEMQEANLRASVEAALPALAAGVTSAVEEAVSAQTGRENDDDGAGARWAEVVSRGRKRKEGQKNKNLLILKAGGNEKAVDKKKKVEEALSDVQILDSRFTSKGNIVMNFESEEGRAEAQNKLHGVDNLNVSCGRRLNPKIMICNVAQVEDGDSIIDTVIERNDLSVIDGVKDKMSVIFHKPAAGGTVHYVLKCDPEVRAFIHRKNDKLKLKWGVYQVRDRYHALMCYHCLKFGHKMGNCQAKANGLAPHCYKCAGKHEGRTCRSDVRKCLNCNMAKRRDDHGVSSLTCPIFAAEINRIRLSTDHGF